MRDEPMIGRSIKPITLYNTYNDEEFNPVLHEFEDLHFKVQYLWPNTITREEKLQAQPGSGKEKSSRRTLKI